MLTVYRTKELLFNKREIRLKVNGIDYWIKPNSSTQINSKDDEFVIQAILDWTRSEELVIDSKNSLNTKILIKPFVTNRFLIICSAMIPTINFLLILLEKLFYVQIVLGIIVLIELLFLLWYFVIKKNKIIALVVE